MMTFAVWTRQSNYKYSLARIVSGKKQGQKMVSITTTTRSQTWRGYPKSFLTLYGIRNQELLLKAETERTYQEVSFLASS